MTPRAHNPASPARYRNGGRLLLLLAVSGAALYLALRGARAAEVWQTLRQADALRLLLALVCGFGSHILRAARWRALVARPTAFRPLLVGTLLGNLANTVLPLRLGEVARLYWLERQTGVSKSAGAATIVLERVLDGVLLLGWLALLSFLLEVPGELRAASRVAAAGFLAVAAMLLALAFKGAAWLSWLKRHTGGTSWHLVPPWLAGALERFAGGLQPLRSARQCAWLIVLTAAVWMVEALTVWLVLGALQFTLPWLAALFVLIVLSLSFLLPAAPGAVGTYEFFTVAALTPFAIGRSQALGLALALHAIVLLNATLPGLVCLWTEGLAWRVLRGNTDS